MNLHRLITSIQDVGVPVSWGSSRARVPSDPSIFGWCVARACRELFAPADRPRRHVCVTRLGGPLWVDHECAPGATIMGRCWACQRSPYHTLPHARWPAGPACRHPSAPEWVRRFRWPSKRAHPACASILPGVSAKTGSSWVGVPKLGDMS